MFITFEGLDGSGKSTQVAILAKRLRNHGYRVTETREPGGTEFGEDMRELLLNHNMDTRTEVMLFNAARSELVKNVIHPALHRGDVVICDRYAESTLAYQGEGDLVDVRMITDYASYGLHPDHIIYLDIDPSVSLSRQGDRDRFEEEGLEYHEAVRSRYLAMVDERWIVVDASMGIGDVVEAVWRGAMSVL